MTDTELIEETTTFVKETLQNAEGGHDWFHIERVFNNSILISKEEKVDLLVVSLGALLHDIADAKFNDGNESLGPQMAEDFLSSMGASKSTIDHVVKIIKYSSFKAGLAGDNSKQKIFSSMELHVVQDADRLDAIGAVGIARAFNYGGFKNRTLYDPSIPPNLEMTKEQYKKSNAPTINHFYEKLLLLKEKMNTKTGKRIAKERHQFMLDYLEQFYKEWNPLFYKNLKQ
ncbi:HD domain-containing protein [Maribacter sp. ACAM166]|uniref:HD domain-containing protein n=1 Tax=Maribacter sp. ACAM166 TaxID=2508996 RepID=UPI0010FD42B5|nr:HD domain-containing protein [Maribacter sp. ACAM166]TLP75867.1 HD domain-containing protein [Maribacter sp. ACAM166]